MSKNQKWQVVGPGEPGNRGSTWLVCRAADVAALAQGTSDSLPCAAEFKSQRKASELAQAFNERSGEDS
jgi:hypothetical protein